MVSLICRTLKKKKKFDFIETESKMAVARGGGCGERLVKGYKLCYKINRI